LARVTRPLSSRRLRRIVVAYTVNRMGTWIGLLALLAAVFDHTHSALAIAALMFAGQALPAFVVPAVVARVEASRGRGELAGLYLFEAVVTVLLAILLWHFSLAPILLLAALDGTAALAASALLRAEVARAARDAAMAHHGGEAAERLAGRDAPPSEAAQEAERRANGALNVSASTSFVLGPVIGGVIVAAAGAPAALFVDAGSFLICAALLVDLHPHVEEAGGDSVRERLRSAWRYISEAPSLRGLLLAEAAALVFFEAGAPIEVTYAKATLHAGDRGLGLLLTSWGAGGIIGSLAFARLVRRPLGVMLSVGTTVIGLGYLGLAAAPSLTIACIAGVIGGIGNGMQWPSLISVVQRLTPARLHGRLMGAVESLGAMSVAIGLPLGGAIVALSSPRPGFVVIGAGAVVTTVALARLSLRPEARGAGEESEARTEDRSPEALSPPAPVSHY
jgi:MFS family permease